MRSVSFAPEEYFHIYNRGTNKMQIFMDNADYSRFQKLLFTTNSRQTVKFSDLDTKSPYRVWTLERGDTLVDIGAYTLMPNHFHLLIKSKNEKDTALFLQRLLLSYSKYFNKKYDRTGNLFQGKSKAEHLDQDAYLRYIYTYIHLNIIKILEPDWKDLGLRDLDKAKEYLRNQPYSSFLDYLGIDRVEKNILNKSAFPEYFQTIQDFKEEIDIFLNYGKE